jgi:hypothetical protein
MLAAALALVIPLAQPADRHAWRAPGVPVGNVFPALTVRAPGVESSSETGIGALIPWADRLWAVGYVAHIKGAGIGLYEIRDDLSFRLHPASITGTFANRMVHWETQQAVIGPHVIGADGKVRTFAELARHRLAATARHLIKPDTMAYFLTMEGRLFEADLVTLETRPVADLVKELGIDGGYLHFKGAHTAQGRLVVANNSYAEEEYLGKRAPGRLAEWDGKTWTVLERNPFVEVSGKQNPRTGAHYGNTLYALGWDRASVLLRVLHAGRWTRYRLPKGSQSFDHQWNTEWMRIREAQTERYLMDAHGIFYDLPPLVYGGRVWGIKPIASHLRVVPDFCYFRGLLVLGGDQTDNAVGQPQSGFWFGGIDDLHRMGKPTGWGGPWWHDEVRAGEPSDPYLMTGFDTKALHVSNEGRAPVVVTVEVDFLGDGSFRTYRALRVAAGGYVHHEFPAGFSAHWVRLTSNRASVLSAQLFY